MSYPWVMPRSNTDPDVLADKAALRAIPIHERPKRMRGRLHQGAFIASIPAGLLLVLLAPDARARIATAICAAVTLTGLFGVSAATTSATGRRPRTRACVGSITR